MQGAARLHDPLDADAQVGPKRPADDREPGAVRDGWVLQEEQPHAPEPAPPLASWEDAPPGAQVVSDRSARRAALGQEERAKVVLPGAAQTPGRQRFWHEKRWRGLLPWPEEQ